MTGILARRDATLRTMNRFIGKPIDFAADNDCGKMAIFQLREMGRRPRIGPGGTWKSVLGARRFLARHGGSVAAVLDGWGLPRILPSEAWIGDIMELQGEPPFGALSVCLGNGRVLGWHEDADACAVLQPVRPIAAWRL